MNRQLELGRGGAALPDRQAATGTVPPHARATGPATGDELWGPATCNVPTADSIILRPFSPTLPFPPLPEQQQPFCSSRYPLRVCFQSFRCLPACVPQYSCPSSSIDRHIHFSPSPRHSASRLDLRAGDTDNRHKEFRALAEALHFLHPS